MQPSSRFHGIELSLIRQINALATPSSINLGIGEPNIEPDETFRGMARQVASTASWHYSANAGTLALREQIAERYAPAHDPRAGICVTAGTQEALFAIMQAFVNPGDEVLVPDPGFVAYATIARIAGGVPVPYPLEPPMWQLDPPTVIERFTVRTKLVILNSPSNPLGTVISDSALRAVCVAAAERDILVISDEIYREIWYDAPPASALGMGKNVIVIDGLSKSHGMTGLRLGWVIADESLMRTIVTAHQYIATCASVFSQALAEEIFRQPVWNQQWLSSVRAQFREQREVVTAAISRELEVELDPPPAAFYAFVPVPSCDTLTFARTLATDAGVLVIPGVAFGIQGEGFIRISYAAPREQLAAGLEKIGRWLRSQGR